MDIVKVSASIWAAMKVEPDLAVAFLAIFARFEYALKREGYLQTINGSALPNWDRFAADLTAESTEEVVADFLTRVSYLANKPTRRQMVTNGQLGWDSPTPPLETLSDLLRTIRTTRNNLFHGGKFPLGPIDEPLRDSNLISESAATLLWCLEWDCDTARRMRNTFWRFDSDLVVNSSEPKHADGDVFRV
jgi:hypothetical protein